MQKTQNKSKNGNGNGKIGILHIDEFESKFKANISHQYVFHFNSGDYIPITKNQPKSNYKLIDYFASRFASVQCFVIYDRTGVSFLNENSKKVFIEEAGLGLTHITGILALFAIILCSCAPSI